MNKWSKDLMDAIGITDHTDIEEPLIDEGHAPDDEFFIKFMSDFGKRDEEQGLAFRNWMDQNGIQYNESTTRSYIVNADQFETEFGPLF